MSALLQSFVDARQSLPFEELDAPLVHELQTRLCALGLLDPGIGGDEKTPFRPVSTSDGQFGNNTFHALAEFCRLAGSPFDGLLLTPLQVRILLIKQPGIFLPVHWENAAGDDTQTRLAKRVLRYMDQSGYWIARGPDMFNIVYLEGMNGDGTLNDDAFNTWNDRRLAIRIAPGGRPEMWVNDLATSEPGEYYTLHPKHPHGAARIAFGQYKAWKMGLHHGLQPALVQRGLLRVYRDHNKDGKRNRTDPIDIGSEFHLNQHTTIDGPVSDFVKKFSAGCLVGRSYQWHLSFLDILKQDTRFRRNDQYLFMSTIIAGDELAKSQG